MMADPVTDMRAFLAICCLDDVTNDPTMLGFIKNKCIVSIDDFKRLSFEDDVKAMVKQYNTVVAALRQLSCIQEKNIMALTFWVFDQARRQLNFNVNEQGDNALGAAVDEMTRYKEQNENGEKDGAIMDKIETGLKWHDWDTKFKNFLAARVGYDGIPLDYVVQHEKPAGWDPWHDAKNEHKQLYDQV